MRAAVRAMPGVATPDVVTELQAVHQGLDELLQAGSPTSALYSLDDVRTAMAECLDFIARAYESMRDDQKAAEYFERAVVAYEAMGKSQDAERSRAKLPAIRISQGKGIDQEIQRLHERMARIRDEPLERAQVLVELGELTSQGGDDYAAKGHFEEALALLDRLGFPEPGGGDLARALGDTMATILSNRQGGGAPTEIETMVGIRALYRRIYLGLVRVYTQIDPERAKDYERKLAEMDSPEVNKEFAERMKRFLPPLGPSDTSDPPG